MTRQRRLFNKRERDALFLAADGRSDMSGELLNDDWQADHIFPWSLGGVTDVANGQALNADENRSKADKPEIFNLISRPWQQRFFVEYQKAGQQDFMVAALPAAGKTRAALSVARYHLDDPAARLIVVVPTDHVRTQWRTSAKVFQIELQTKEFSGSLKTNFHGVVTTYAAIATSPMLFRRLCGMHRAMVIFDEIHHAGDKSAWGISIQRAFENAHRRLCLSGTPFKHDGQKIPFLKINLDGFYDVDFSYDYPAAIRDGVIREVAFHRYGGSVEIAYDDEFLTFHTSDALNDDDSARRLSGLLRSAEFTRGILRAAHEKLMAVRRSKPDAGALALCIDANHAVKIAKLIEEITGESPDIVVSDSEKATGDIEGYANSHRKWIVAVRMVSEGVDIPRLMVLAYLTNTTTDLFFRQAIGRIQRNQGTDFDTEAYCFIPDDPTLGEQAARIEEFQRQIIAEEEEQEQNAQDDAAERERRVMQVLSATEAEFAGVTLRGSRRDTADAIKIREIAERHQVAEAKVAAILEEAMFGQSGSRHGDEKSEEQPLEVRLTNLRRKAAKLANRAAIALGIEPKEVHLRYMKIANVRQPNMTESQLEAKIQWLIKQVSN